MAEIGTDRQVMRGWVLTFQDDLDRLWLLGLSLPFNLRVCAVP